MLSIIFPKFFLYYMWIFYKIDIVSFEGKGFYSRLYNGVFVGFFCRKAQ